MASKHSKKKQTYKINFKRFVSVIGMIIALIVIVIIAVNAMHKKAEEKNKAKENSIVEYVDPGPGINKDLSILTGTYVYNESIKYTFDGKSRGVLYDKQNEYPFTYEIDGQLLILTFDNPEIHKAVYTAYFLDRDLKLIGGNLGGEYILKREK